MATIAHRPHKALPLVCRVGLALAALVVVAGLNAGCSNPSRYRGAWCANLMDAGPYECNYQTYEQCQAVVSGVGGFCEANRNVSRNSPAPRRRSP